MAGPETPPRSLKTLGTYSAPPLPIGRAQTIRADPHAPAREGLAGWLNWLASFAVPIYPEQEVGPVDLLAAVPPLKALKAFATEAKVADAVGDAAKGIRAYHGSPHDFDRFALEKIGTGEGAQAYGHGLYFAEQEATAKAYRDQLSGASGINPNAGRGRGKLMVGDMPPPEGIAGHAALDTAQDIQGLLYYKKNGYDDMVNVVQPQIERRIATFRAEDAKGYHQGIAGEDMRALADYYDNHVKTASPASIGERPPGKMYEVQINADPEHFLDWDAPLSQQSEKVRYAFGAMDAPKLQARLDEVVRLKNAKATDRLANNMMRDEKGWHALANEADALQAELNRMESGAKAYQTLMMDERDVAIRQGLNADTTLPKSQAAASKTLRDFGIPGIKYLDQGSRARTGGELIDVFHGPEGWQSKIRVSRGGDTHFTTSAPHPTREAAEQWAQNAINSGTRNYVVFDDALIDIIRKYGLLPPLSLAALGQYGQAQPAQEPTR